MTVGDPVLGGRVFKMAAATLFVLFNFSYKHAGVNNLDVLKMFDISQVRISGNNVVCFSFQGAGDEHIIFWIFRYVIDTILTFVAIYSGFLKGF
jgi:hypothetical protein